MEGASGLVIDLSNHPCLGWAEGAGADFSCSQVDAPITEWCPHCRALFIVDRTRNRLPTYLDGSRGCTGGEEADYRCEGADGRLDTVARDGATALLEDLEDAVAAARFPDPDGITETLDELRSLMTNRLCTARPAPPKVT